MVYEIGIFEPDMKPVILNYARTEEGATMMMHQYATEIFSTHRGATMSHIHKRGSPPIWFIAVKWGNKEVRIVFRKVPRRRSSPSARAA